MRTRRPFRTLLFLALPAGAALAVAACGLGVEHLEQFENDCRPGLKELQELPGEKFSIARFCWCYVKDKRPVPDCHKYAEGARGAEPHR